MVSPRRFLSPFVGALSIPPSAARQHCKAGSIVSHPYCRDEGAPSTCFSILKMAPCNRARLGAYKEPEVFP
jgi:hypothetical protein